MTAQSDIPQPREGFLPAGTVIEAQFGMPQKITHQRYTGTRKAGVTYEKNVHKLLTRLYGDMYVQSPWLRFRSVESDRWRWCQPDGMILDYSRGIITVVEVKLRHTHQAWWQLKHLYLPVLRRLFPKRLWRFQLCEVVIWYDCDAPFPEPVHLAADICEDTQKFKVHIWKP